VQYRGTTTRHRRISRTTESQPIASFAYMQRVLHHCGNHRFQVYQFHSSITVPYHSIIIWNRHLARLRDRTEDFPVLVPLHLTYNNPNFQFIPGIGGILRIISFSLFFAIASSIHSFILASMGFLSNLPTYGYLSCN
jgi:hypothetical protein